MFSFQIYLIHAFCFKYCKGARHFCSPGAECGAVGCAFMHMVMLTNSYFSLQAPQELNQVLTAQ